MCDICLQTYILSEYGPTSVSLITFLVKHRFKAGTIFSVTMVSAEVDQPTEFSRPPHVSSTNRTKKYLAASWLSQVFCLVQSTIERSVSNTSRFSRKMYKRVTDKSFLSPIMFNNI